MEQNNELINKEVGQLQHNINQLISNFEEKWKATGVTVALDCLGGPYYNSQCKDRVQVTGLLFCAPFDEEEMANQCRLLAETLEKAQKKDCEV